MAKTPFNKPTNIFILTPWPLTIILFVIICLVAFAWRNYQPANPSLTALNLAFQHERPLESRISDLAYAPLKTTRGTADNKSDNVELERAKLLALNAVSENPTAENRHALARVYLAEKEFDKAIEQLEKAIKLTPGNARMHNDLGIAQMEKAKPQDEGKLENMAKAIEEFGRAIELDQNLSEAYFNRALCINHLEVLPNQSKEAWEDYLKFDSNSKWTEEAREYLNELDENTPISKTKEEVLQEFLEAKQTNNTEKAWQILSRNRSLSSGKLIPQQLAFMFIASKATGDKVKAEEALNALVYAGKLEEEKSGDLFWRDLAKYYQTVSDDRILQLKQAKDQYFQTVLDKEATIKKADYKKSIAELEKAQKLYLEANNKLEPKLIDFLIGYLINREAKIRESNEKLKELADFCRKKNYKWLENQAITWLAANEFSERKLSQAYLKTKTALALSKETEDLLSLQKNYYHFAEINFLMGQFEKSFDNIQQNLELGKLPGASLPERWRALNSTSHYLVVP